MSSPRDRASRGARGDITWRAPDLHRNKWIIVAADSDTFGALKSTWPLSRVKMWHLKCHEIVACERRVVELLSCWAHSFSGCVFARVKKFMVQYRVYATAGRCAPIVLWWGVSGWLDLHTGDHADHYTSHCSYFKGNVWEAYYTSPITIYILCMINTEWSIATNRCLFIRFTRQQKHARTHQRWQADCLQIFGQENLHF